MSVWPRFGGGTIDPFVRRRIEDEIERLIMVLDAIDADPDWESDADGEPDDTGIADWPGLYQQIGSSQ